MRGPCPLQGSNLTDKEYRTTGYNLSPRSAC
jgi:hypothetical protein